MSGDPEEAGFASRLVRSHESEALCPSLPSPFLVLEA